MHQYDRVVEHVLGIKGVADAREWLAGSTPSAPRCIGEFDLDESKYIVENAIAMGGENVRVVAPHNVIDGSGSADAVAMELPDDPAMRERLFAFEAQVNSETGFDPTPDDGMHYLFVRWK